MRCRGKICHRFSPLFLPGKGEHFIFGCAESTIPIYGGKLFFPLKAPFSSRGRKRNVFLLLPFLPFGLDFIGPFHIILPPRENKRKKEGGRGGMGDPEIFRPGSLKIRSITCAPEKSPNLSVGANKYLGKRSGRSNKNCFRSQFSPKLSLDFPFWPVFLAGESTSISRWAKKSFLPSFFLFSLHQSGKWE